MGAFTEGSGIAIKPPSDYLGSRMRVVSWLMLSLAIIFVVLRVYCKTVNARGLWWDDYILLLAFIIFVTNVSLTEVNIHYGMGSHIYYIEPENLAKLELYGNISGFISIFASIFSKISFAVTLLRITHGYWRVAVWLCIFVVLVSMGISAVFIWVNPGGDVVVNYGIFGAVCSGAIDLALAMLPWNIIWGLQMKLKEKIGVGVAMSMGIFAATTAFIKASKIPSLSSGDFTYYGAELIIWSAAEVGTTVMAASIPVLRVLFMHMKSSYVNSADKHTHPQSARPGHSLPGGTGSGGAGASTLSGSATRKTDPDEDVLVTKGPRAESPGSLAHSDGGDFDLPSAGGASSVTMRNEMDFGGATSYEMRPIGHIV